MTDVEFLLVSEVAVKLRVSARTVYRLIDSGRLESHRVGIGQGGLRVTPAALTAFLDRSQQTTAQPA